MKNTYSIKPKHVFGLLLLIFMASFFNKQLAAQDQNLTNDDLYEMDLEALMDIKVVSASKFSQNQSDAPNIISLVPNKQISAYGWLSANEVLTYQPGFFPAQDYDRRVIGLRGMFEGWNNNHLLMLVDGVPFNDNLYGTAYTWEITPLVFTKNIELIRGPGGALYGTNAMNGVITMNTMRASDFDKIGIARARFGSNNTQVYDFAVGNENENVGMVLAINNYNTDGNEYDSYDASLLTDSNFNKSIVKDKRQSTYLFSHIYGKNKYEGLSLQYHEQHWDYKTGHGWLFEIPDRPENLREYRRLITLRYAPQSNRAFNYEITSRYQKHGIDWNLRYYKNNAFGGFYPNSVTEYLKTDAEDIFTRLQIDYNMNNHILLAGIETDFFLYDGDEAHTSNTDLNDAGGFYYNDTTFINPGDGWYPFRNNEDVEMGPWFEFIKNKPVNNIAAFMQYMSPKIGERLQMTLSSRYDQMFFNYIKTNEPDQPEAQKTFDMITPRAAAVFNISDAITLKAIYGKAFRTPAPTEMFGSNTWTLASNIEQLEPEIITNFDLGIDWMLSENMYLRLNGYWIDFENQIAYSVQNNNLSTNLFSYETTGAEVDLQFSFSKHLSGFANYTHSIRLNEEIADTTISVSKDEITWAPLNTANLGLSYKYSKLHATAMLHYQGEMKRRESDIYDGMEAYRPKETVDGWIDVGMKIAYKFNNDLELAIVGSNLLDQDKYYIKNNGFPFDYRWEKRQVFAELTLDF